MLSKQKLDTKNYAPYRVSLLLSTLTAFFSFFWKVKTSGMYLQKRFLLFPWAITREKKGKVRGEKVKIRDLWQRASHHISQFWKKYQRNWTSWQKPWRLIIYCAETSLKIFNAVSAWRLLNPSQCQGVVSTSLVVNHALRGGLRGTIVVQFAKMLTEEISISSWKELKISQC